MAMPTCLLGLVLGAPILGDGRLGLMGAASDPYGMDVRRTARGFVDGLVARRSVAVARRMHRGIFVDGAKDEIEQAAAAGGIRLRRAGGCEGTVSIRHE